jgi:argininosuccinate lyase
VLDEADDLPLGSGAIAGPSYAIDVEAPARDLGFSRIARNSMDASGDRDFVSAFLHASALSMVHVSRLAEDVILFTTEEFGFFDLADTAATGSSLMPQKKNPDPMELVRGKAGRAIGHLAGWLASMKGLPAGYNKDLQEDKEAVFDAEDTWIASLRATATVIRGLTPRADAARAAASGLLLATAVADYLVDRGVPVRDAHALVGAIVRRLIREGRSFESLSLAEWREHSPLFGEDVKRAIAPEASIARKKTPQSTNPHAVAAALAETRAWARDASRT